MSRPASSRLVVPLLIGAAVAVALGVYGSVHDPAQHALFTLFFTNTIKMKSWLATGVVVLAIVQVLLALRLYGKIQFPRTAPRWLGDLHRFVGTALFVLSLPVAFHCLWGLGFHTDGGSRRMFHSLFGCAFYGAFATKVLAVRAKGLPDWALPVVGGIVFSTLVVIWLTSSLWFFQNTGLGI